MRESGILMDFSVVPIHTAGLSSHGISVKSKDENEIFSQKARILPAFNLMK